MVTRKYGADQSPADILAAHADQLVASGRSGVPPGGQWGRTSSGSRTDQVQELLDLAEELQSILVPVEPDRRFRRRLHGELILEAQRREVEPAPSLLWQHRKGIIIGAAAVGSVASVVGVALAVVLRHRHGGATRIAAG